MSIAAAHRAVGVVGRAERRAPLRHHGVADELVQRAAVPEHALHHLGEVLGQQASPSRPGFIVSESAVKPRMSLNSTATGRLSPPSLIASGELAIARGELRREVALEVAAHERLAPDALGELRVLDRDGGDAGERDEELEVLVGEAMRRARRCRRTARRARGPRCR